MTTIKGLKSFPNDFLHSEFLCKVHKGSKGKESKTASILFFCIWNKKEIAHWKIAHGNQKHSFIDSHSYSFIIVGY